MVARARRGGRGGLGRDEGRVEEEEKLFCPLSFFSRAPSRRVRGGWKSDGESETTDECVLFLLCLLKQ